MVSPAKHFDEFDKRSIDTRGVIIINSSELTLYHFQSCPFCMRVRNFMAQNNIEMPMKDIQRDPTAREELMEAGGRTMVPALMMADGSVMYESMDIIDWMQRNLVSVKA